MDPADQRIAIAEACGYFIPVYPHGGFSNLLKGYTAIQKLPDYLNDLNAMHNIEINMSVAERSAYRKCLNEVCKPHKPEAGYGERNVHATAAQRAEAFLKTLNLWEESP